jgi:hypothetical protein
MYYKNVWSPQLITPYDFASKGVALANLATNKFSIHLISIYYGRT